MSQRFFAVLLVTTCCFVAVSKASAQQDPATALRINAIEEQLRVLTGQVEQLNFRLREMERAAGGAAPQAGAIAQPRVPVMSGAVGGAANGSGAQAQAQGQGGVGAPPANLGQLRLDDQGQPLDITGLGQALTPGTPGSGVAVPVPENGVATALAAPSSRDDYDTAYGHVLRGDYPAAEQDFKAFIARFPGDALVPNAKFWIGESFYQRGDYQSAARTFLDASQSHPEAPKAPESLLKLGLSLAALQQRDPDCSTFGELMRRYPRADSSVRDQAQSEMRTLGC